jgi:hypothetical protein
MATEGLEQENDVLNSRFYNFEQTHTHWHGIPIGDYSTFNLLKNQLGFYSLWKKGGRGGVGQNSD